jgi:thioredoxin-like negative regulator of GroEL
VSASAVSRSEAQDERPLLVFFYEERSGGSRRVDGYLAQVLQRNRNHDTFRLHRVELSQRPDLARRFGVAEAPTLLVVSDRRIQARLSGPRGCVQIEALLKPWLRCSVPADRHRTTH